MSTWKAVLGRSVVAGVSRADPQGNPSFPPTRHLGLFLSLGSVGCWMKTLYMLA